MLYSRSSSGETIPAIGTEPEQLLVFEGDAKLRLPGKKIRRTINSMSALNLKSVPFDVSGYAEYARSHRTVNTFGKALIDDMESADEIINVSLSDKDWILSSMPSGKTESDRGQLYYYY